jgi:hypothetical protein
MSDVRILLTGLIALARRRKGATRRAGVMDAILVKPVMRMAGKGMPLCPEHFPTLIAPIGTVTLDPPDLLVPADKKNVDIPDGYEAWSLEGLELRFPGVTSNQRAVAHAPDRLTLGHQDVTGAEFDDFSPLTTVANASEAGGSIFDKKWLGPITTKPAPVGARIRLSGGRATSQQKQESVSAFWYWQLKSDHRASGGRPLAEQVVISHQRSRDKPVVLTAAALNGGRELGTVSLLKSEVEIRNFPAPAPQSITKLDHFDAFYALLKAPAQRPIPYVWGRLDVTYGPSRAQRKLVLAVEDPETMNKDMRSGAATCPLTIMDY